MIRRLLDRLSEVKRTYWANHTYLRRTRWESLSPALASVTSGPRVLFYPDYPHENYLIRKLCAYGGIEVTSNPRESYDLGVFFTDRTFASPDAHARIDDTFVNYNCTDISKTNVQHLFAEVFGYALSVDPMTYEGAAVEKSNVNATHDGRIVSCPLGVRDEENVYQKRIDNRVSDDVFLDYRTTIVGDEIPVVVCKYWRHEDDGMPGPVTNAHAEAPDEVFSPGEMRHILQFARQLGLDYGEVDVLRDNEDDHIYIVDANDTPIGPREELSDRDYHAVLDRTLSAFHRNFLSE
jgi:hypothetical protein